jgi:hypothetical protein
MQDTSTQAMTEVALGLSMAFFSLLILALVSIGLPQTADTLASDTKQDSLKMDPESSMTLAQQAPAKDASAEQTGSQPKFVFYYQGAYFDERLQEVKVETIATNDDTIVAVSSTLAFAEVMQVHKDFAHMQVQITAMDKAWEEALMAGGQ